MEDLYLKACEEGHTGVVSKYLRKGLDVNYRDEIGSTGLMKACLNGHYDLAKLLLESNANVNLIDGYGQSALHYATMSNNERLCKLICHAGVDAAQSTKIAQLQARQYSLRTVPLANNANSNERIGYLTHGKAMKQSDFRQNFVIEKDEPRNTDEQIYDMILRYENMVLSEIDSDGGDEVKGEVYSKSKKKKKSGKKGSKKKGAIKKRKKKK